MAFWGTNLACHLWRWSSLSLPFLLIRNRCVLGTFFKKLPLCQPQITLTSLLPCAVSLAVHLSLSCSAVCHRLYFFLVSWSFLLIVLVSLCFGVSKPFPLCIMLLLFLTASSLTLAAFISLMMLLLRCAFVIPYCISLWSFLSLGPQRLPSASSGPVKESGCLGGRGRADFF